MKVKSIVTFTPDNEGTKIIGEKIICTNFRDNLDQTWPK